MADLIPPLPCDFVHQIEQDFPQEAATLLSALDHTEPVVSLRLNIRKCARYKASPSLAYPSTPIPWCQEGYRLGGRPFFAHDPLWHAGVYYVQEAASMALAQLAPLLPKRPIEVLDLCAAPGGKSTLLLNILPENSTLVANEPNPKRAQILRENLLKWGYPNTIVTNNYPDQLAATAAKFDMIVVDAPCSGEGLFRKTPEARLEWSLQSVNECALRQREILDATWTMLRPGGMLVYCTCTFNRHEDEEQAEYLLREYNASLIAAITPPEEWHWIEGKGGVGWHFLPGMTMGEGFYFAAFYKPQEGDNSSTPPPSKAAKKKAERRETSSISFSDIDRRWFLCEEGDEREAGKFVTSPIAPELIQWIPPQLLPKYQELASSQAIRILSAGVSVGESKGKEIVPSLLLPYSQLCNISAFPTIALEREQALAYLAGETLASHPSTPKGFCLVCYEGIPLGFVKNIGSRYNNLYPKPYRLRNLPQ